MKSGVHAPPAQGIFTLGLANAVAMLVSVGAAGVYAQQLDAQQMAHWAMALAVARAGVLVLDGGLKTALVRRADAVHADTTRRLQQMSAMVAAGMLAALAVAVWMWQGRAQIGGPADGSLAWAALLLPAYAAAYWLTYPPMLMPLARLERAQQFSAIGRAEGLSLALEFALPAPLMAAGVPYWAAFVLSAVLARSLRCAWLVRSAHALQAVPTPVNMTSMTSTSTTSTTTMLKEGLGVQAVAALSMVRDQMHLWLLAPWFGAWWAGQYALAMMACALCVQVGALTVSRVALPALRQMPPAWRWPQVLKHTRWLAILTLPPLVLMPLWLAHADSAWWQGRWAAAVLITPWLAARMVPGVATTALGPWLMVARSPWSNARVHALWTAAEIGVAALALLMAGPLGLAMAAAIMPWLALALMLAAASPGEAQMPRLISLLDVLLMRPSLWMALLLAGAAIAHGQWWAVVVASLCLPACWLAEFEVRQWLARLVIGTPRLPGQRRRHQRPASP